MTGEFVQTELVDAGLHEESVEDLIQHYRDMRFHLSNENVLVA